MTDVVKVYKDSSGEWRWRRVAGNGKNVSTSGEGFISKSYAIDSAQRMNPDIELETES